MIILSYVILYFTIPFIAISIIRNSNRNKYIAERMPEYIRNKDKPSYQRRFNSLEELYKEATKETQVNWNDPNPDDIGVLIFWPIILPFVTVNTISIYIGRINKRRVLKKLNAQLAPPKIYNHKKAKDLLEQLINAKTEAEEIPILEKLKKIHNIKS